MAPNHQQRYAAGMKTHGLGHGFLRPPSDIYDLAKPGVCGYIDHNGTWTKIVDVSDQAALKADNFTTPTRVVRPQRPSFHKWGPKYTDTVREISVGAEAGVAAGIPVEFSTVCSYSTKFDFGALLLCGDEVKLESYPEYEPFRRWGSANAKRILELHRDVATHGFFVMVKTWSAQDVYMNTWTMSDHAVTVGVKGSVPEAGSAGGFVEYHRGAASGGWEHPHVDDQERRVLFFGGVFFKYNRFLRRFSHVRQPEWGYLGDSTQGKVLVETDDGDYYEVESSLV